jgi:hypothetical protein
VLIRQGTGFRYCYFPLERKRLAFRSQARRRFAEVKVWNRVSLEAFVQSANQLKEANMQTQNLNQIVAQTDATLIAGDKVAGVGVYRTTGERIGTIRHIMINKRTGQVAYAVMNFGGFLGMGEEGYPIAWSSLSFQEEPDGYVVNLTDEQLGKGLEVPVDVKTNLEASVFDSSPSI